MESSKKRKRATSDMATSNKLSRTANCLTTVVKVTQIANLVDSNIKLTQKAKNVQASQKTNYSDSDVDLILDHKVFDSRIFYLVKWKNQSNKYNLWEPEEKLMGCANLLYYHQVIMNSLENLNEKIVFFFVNDLVTRQPHDILTLTKLCALIYSCTEEVINGLRLTFDELKTKVLKVLEIPIDRLNKKRHSMLNLMRFSEARKLALSNNAEWEHEINKVSPSYVCVENNVNIEEAPTSYQFIRDYESSYVDLTEQPVVFCSCENCYENHDTCCAQGFNGRFAYNNLGRIQLPPGYEIYECNRLCKCGDDCINRVVQHGTKIKMSIFKTSNGCGWGLKTLEPIQKGQFVLEYLGEVITPMDAEIRDEAYDYTGTTYLFDLNFGKESSFTVDAGHKGNASRFINHSCDPNLQVYTVWVNQHDPSLPRLAFFARRKIESGEELTFDYKMDENCDYLKSEVDRVQCKCNSKNCRKYLF